MRKVLTIGAIALLGTLTAGAPAMAQSFEVGPRGFRVDPGYDRDRGDRGRRDRDDSVSEREAIGIARSAGMARVGRISGGYGRVWRVTGIDRRGDELRMVIDDRSGRVISRERE